MTEARDAALERGRDDQRSRHLQPARRREGGYLALHTNPPGGLAKYYRDNVIGGPGAFVVPIDDFKSFDEAMIRKLVSEIAEGAPRGVFLARVTPLR